MIDMRWLAPLPKTPSSTASPAAACADRRRMPPHRLHSEALMALFTERTNVPHARLTAEDSFIATGPAYGATMPSSDNIVATARRLLEGEA